MKEITILLVENHTVVRESIRQSLGREPNLKVVGEASNGEEAVVMAEQLKPDVILMDVAMPRMNGIEATKEIKAILPSVAILILTAYDYEHYVFPLLDAGASGYLLKDVSSRELVAAINSVYRGDVVLHPDIAQKLTWHFDHARDKQVTEDASSLLTEKEMAVLKMAAKGMTNSSIAGELKLNIRTVESRLCTIFNKCGVASRTEAVIQAVKRGWVKLEDLP